MSSSERLRLQVSPWLALLLGAFVLLSSPALLAALLTAALVHELAHWAVLRRLGGEVRSLQLGLFGARMEIAHPERLSYGGEMLVTAAGPLVNLLLAPGLAWLGRGAEVFWLFAGLSWCSGASTFCRSDRSTAGGFCGWRPRGGMGRSRPTGSARRWGLRRRWR